MSHHCWFNFVFRHHSVLNELRVAAALYLAPQRMQPQEVLIRQPDLRLLTSSYQSDVSWDLSPLSFELFSF